MMSYEMNNNPGIDLGTDLNDPEAESHDPPTIDTGELMNQNFDPALQTGEPPDSKDNYQPADLRPKTGTRRVSLSAREVQVLKLLVRGLSNREIALALGVSIETVKTHMKNILAKFDATSRTQAVVRAIKEGVISDTDN